MLGPFSATKILQSADNDYARRTTSVGVSMVIPVFCVVLSDGERWAVEAEWPDGTIEQIDTFQGHSDAVNWVSTQSQMWLRERQTLFIRPQAPA
jgi:hypothetical protein